MFHVVIPARFGSTRLPGKALADIGGMPMTWHVWQRAQHIGAASVIVATDDQRIASALEPLGIDVAMTRGDHRSGTDRLAEVVEQRRWADDEIVVNLQGDEPLMPAENLCQVATLLEQDARAVMSTLSAPITGHDEFLDPSAVKVVVDGAGRALYFSRAPIPYPRDTFTDKTAAVHGHRHIGLYAYRAGFLRTFATLPPSPLEQLESLEQLRVLEQGAIIQVAIAAQPVPPGVDTPADLDRVRMIMSD